MELRDLTLPLGSDPAELAYAGNARLINCVPEPLGKGRSVWLVMARDGHDAFATLTGAASGVRGMLALNDADLYVVAGRLLYRVDKGGAVTLLGGIASDGMVTMARNRASIPQIAIVCDGLYYGVQGGVLQQLSDPDLPPPVSVDSIGGYFIFFLADGRHFASGLDDWGVNALSFATAEANPDGGVRNIVRGSDMVFLGRRSLEFWQVNGEDPYPLARTTFRDNIGCIAGDSVAQVDQTIAFVAHDKTVRILDGYDPAIISSFAVARDIEDLADPSTIVGTSWQRRQHTYYAISCPAWTWVYDLSTKLWHERKSYGFDRWNVNKTLLWNNHVVCGSSVDGTLTTMNHDTHTDVGTDIVMTMQMPPVHSFPLRTRHGRLDLDIVPGTAGVEITDPRVMIDWADEDGKNFGTQITYTMGKTAQTLNRIRISRLGSAYSRTYRVSMSAAVKRCVLGAKLLADAAGT